MIACPNVSRRLAATRTFSHASKARAMPLSIHRSLISSILGARFWFIAWSSTLITDGRCLIPVRWLTAIVLSSLCERQLTLSLIGRRTHAGLGRTNLRASLSRWSGGDRVEGIADAIARIETVSVAIVRRVL
jgi:hypothetical protein